jgi:hypothetical protein
MLVEGRKHRRSAESVKVDFCLHVHYRGEIPWLQSLVQSTFGAANLMRRTDSPAVTCRYGVLAVACYPPSTVTGSHLQLDPCPPSRRHRYGDIHV